MTFVLFPHIINVYLFSTYLQILIREMFFQAMPVYINKSSLRLFQSVLGKKCCCKQQATYQKEGQRMDPVLIGILCAVLGILVGAAGWLHCLDWCDSRNLCGLQLKFWHEPFAECLDGKWRNDWHGIPQNQKERQQVL